MAKSLTETINKICGLNSFQDKTGANTAVHFTMNYAVRDILPPKFDHSYYWAVIEDPEVNLNQIKSRCQSRQPITTILPNFCPNWYSIALNYV